MMVNGGYCIVRAIIFFSMGRGFIGGDKFLERKIGGHKIFDDQNAGSHKMTTDRVFYFVQKD